MASSNSFEGTVVGVPSSFRIIVQPRSAKAPLMTLIPACIRVPSGSDEPLSFAARDMVRKQFLGQEVHCSYVKEHARISRLQDGLEITVALVRAGLATCNELDRVYNDFSQHKRELIELQEAAVRRGVGLHDPCLRGASTLRRTQPFPSRRDDPLTRRETVRAILSAKSTFRFSVEKILNATSFAGYFMPSMQSVSVRLLGLKPPRTDNLCRNVCQRINVKLVHRVVTVVVHGFDEDNDDFIVELTSATYKRMFGELVTQGLLLTDRSLQLPAAVDAYNHDREVMLAEQREQQLLLKEKARRQAAAGGKEKEQQTTDCAKGKEPLEAKSAAASSAKNTSFGVAPAGLGADTPASAGRSPVPRPAKPSPSHNPAADPLLSPAPTPSGPEGGFDIAINLGRVFGGDDADTDPFADPEADRRVAKMAADLMGNLLGDTGAACQELSSKRFDTLSPEQHPISGLGGDPAVLAARASATEPSGAGGEVDSVLDALEALPPPMRIEDRLPWRERLPVKNSRFRRGLVVGVRNEVTIDVVEERIFRNASRSGGSRRGGGRKDGGPRNTVVREFYKIRIAGLGAPTPYEEVEGAEGALTVFLAAKELHIRECIRRLLIGQEVQFYLTDGLKLNADSSVSAVVYVGMREYAPVVPRRAPAAQQQGDAAAQPLSTAGTGTESATIANVRRGWMDVSHYARAIVDPSEIEKIHAEAAAAAAELSSSDEEDEAGKKSAATNPSPNSADAPSSTTTDGKSGGAATAAATCAAGSTTAANGAPLPPSESCQGEEAAKTDKEEAVEDEVLLDMFIPRAEHSVFDFNRFNRMLQRGAPTDDELSSLLSGTWAVKPSLVPLAPLVPAGDDAPLAAINGPAVVGGAEAPSTAALLPPIGGKVTTAPAAVAADLSNVQHPDPVDSSVAPHSASNDRKPEELVAVVDHPAPEHEVDLSPPRVVISYVSSASLAAALQSPLGRAVHDCVIHQYVPAVVEEFTNPLSLSVYIPEIQAQLPFELRHVHLPPVNFGASGDAPTAAGGGGASPAAGAAADDKSAAKDKKDGKGRRRGKDRKKGGKAEEDVATAGAAPSPPTPADTAVASAAVAAVGSAAPITDRERVVFADICEFLEDSLVHRDCLLYAEGIDAGRQCLVGSIAVPHTQLPHRWRNKLSATKGLPSLLPAPDGTDEPLVDVLHALVGLGMCAVTPSRIIADGTLEVVTQITTAQQTAREKRLGIWDPQCPNLQECAKAPLNMRSAPLFSPSAAGAAASGTDKAGAGEKSGVKEGSGGGKDGKGSEKEERGKGDKDTKSTGDVAALSGSGCLPLGSSSSGAAALGGIIPLIKPSSPRATARSRKIVPLRRVDPFSFLFRYDDKENTDKAKELQDLLRNSSKVLPRTARVHPGDLVVICKKTVKITKKKPLTRREKELERKKEREAKEKEQQQGDKEGGKDKDKDKDEKESDEVREEIITYHRAKIASRVVMHGCRVNFVDSTDTDVLVHLREIRLPDDEGKIEAFPHLLQIARHSFIQPSEEARRFCAAKAEEEAAAKEAAKKDGGSKKDGDEKGGAGGAAAAGEGTKDKDKDARRDRGGRGGGKQPRPTKQQEKAAALQKEFDALCAYTDALAKKGSLYMAGDYRVGSGEVHGFIFESDKDGKGPNGALPPGTVTLLRTCPHMLTINTALADESPAFVPIIRHLIDMVKSLGTASLVLPAASTVSDAAQ